MKNTYRAHWGVCRNLISWICLRKRFPGCLHLKSRWRFQLPPPHEIESPWEREKRIEQVMRGMNQTAYDRRQWELDQSKRETLVKLERAVARQRSSSRRVPAILGQRGTTGRRADIEVSAYNG